MLLSDSNLFIRSEIVFAQAESVLSSAKLWIEEDSMKKKRLLIEKSNRSGPTIEPCGTPVVIFTSNIQNCYMCCLYGHIVFDSLNRRSRSSRSLDSSAKRVKTC